MHIGILRHAIAEDDSASGSDYDRQLTRAGRIALDHHLDLIEGWGWTPSVILCSPFVRTMQTAHAVGARMPAVPIQPSEVIPLGMHEEILRLCAPHTDPLIVGHEPTVGRLVARLLGAPAGATPMDKAGFALLDVDRIPMTRPARLLLFLAPLPER